MPNYYCKIEYADRRHSTKPEAESEGLLMPELTGLSAHTVSDKIMKTGLYNGIREAGNSYICRLKKNEKTS